MMSLSVSNATSAALTVWIEPWCDELTLPPRSTLALVSGDSRHGDGVADLEVVDDRLVVWATAPGTLSVAIDDILQDTGSRMIDLPPELFEIPVKTFVSTVFDNQPGARVAGAPLTRPVGRLTRLWQWLGTLLRL